jgi:malate synthase
VNRNGIVVAGDAGEAGSRVLTPDALAFVAGLHREFEPARRELLAARTERQNRIAAG